MHALVLLAALLGQVRVGDGYPAGTTVRVEIYDAAGRFSYAFNAPAGSTLIAPPGQTVIPFGVPSPPPTPYAPVPPSPYGAGAAGRAPAPAPAPGQRRPRGLASKVPGKPPGPPPAVFRFE